MLRTARMFALLALVVSTILTGTAPAIAAPVSWSSVDVVLHADSQSPLLIVSGTVPQGTSFPAEGVLNVPAGVQLQWIGEVLGGPVDQDPELKPQVSRSGDWDVYSFTMQKGPSAQVEALAPGSVATSGTAQTASVAWVANQDVPEASVRVRIPVGSQLGELPADAKLEPGPTGFSYVSRTVQNVKQGDTLGLQFAFVPGAASSAGTAGGATTAATSNTSSTLVPTLLVAGLLAALVALFVGVRRKMRERYAVESEDSLTSAKSVDSSTAFDDDDEAAVPAGSGGAPTSARRPSPARYITIGVVVVLVIGALVAVNVSTKPKVAEGKITQQIAQVDQCTSATFALNLPKGMEAQEAADELFSALRTANGVGLVTVYTDDPRIEVGFCESNTTEDAVRGVLAPTGLLAQ